ncbi:MAG: YheU family protein [Oceanospirillaceae bacterium]|nr:YheU family protein [Oceanospirillaceae bacterium]
MIIPYKSLAADTLKNLIEEFVTRDGTDYGNYELSMAEKVSAVESRLSSGEVVIMYIENTESVNIVERQLLANS